MKLLSLWEPWATLMAIGAKRIETRSWSTPYRGWLAIHASKGGLPKRDLEYFLSEPEFRLALSDEKLRPGCIVTVVKLIDCCPTVDHLKNPAFPCAFRKYPELDTEREREFGDFSLGRWAWVTSDVFRLSEPIPFKGKQGLVDVPADVLAELRRQWRGKDAVRA